MNNDIIITKGIESTPNFDISATVRFKYTRHLSGMANTRFINMQYLPNVAIEFNKTILNFKFNDKVSDFFYTMLPVFIHIGDIDLFRSNFSYIYNII